MGRITSAYRRSDQWLRSLSQRRYAAFIGMAGIFGVLVVGLLFGDFLIVEALTMGLVTFGLEAVFGLHQDSEE